MKSGKFNFKPSRRVFIPKSNGSAVRPLGIGNPREKIVQKALAVLLEAIWEPTFSPNSYGFRPKRSIHQALYQIYLNGSTFPWVIQGDISKCFDGIPHDVIMRIISKRIKCEKTLLLIRKTLTAGYIDPDTGEHIIGDTGTLEGNILSPILANITLNELDIYLDKIKEKFDSGVKRARNKEYAALTSKIQKLEIYHPGSPDIKELSKRRRLIPTTDIHDPNLKRLRYVRCVNDFIVLVTGTQHDAIKIKHWIGSFLKLKCGLELNMEKTVVTNTKDGFRFLGA